TLEQLDAGEGLAPHLPDHVPSMTLDAGEVTGTSGVNTFFGDYSWKSDGSFMFGSLAHTEIGGPPEAMAQEAAFFEALQAVTRFELADTKLLLSDDDARTLLVFVPDSSLGN
ncbi:MAG: META domain-containing protein, partial [Actinobacteria bacterium]|nr:META domain-containing protein [Actinomycetota bacterium]